MILIVKAHVITSNQNHNTFLCLRLVWPQTQSFEISVCVCVYICV